MSSPRRRQASDNIPSIFTGNRSNDAPRPPGQSQASTAPQSPTVQRENSSTDTPRYARQFRQRAGSQTGLGDLGLRSQDANDRVFPIRSVVSVDPNPSLLSRSDTTDSYFSSASYRHNSQAFSPSSEVSHDLGSARSRSRSGSRLDRAEQEERTVRARSGSRQGGSRKSSQDATANGDEAFHLGRSSAGQFAAGFNISADAHSERSESLKSSVKPPSIGRGSVGRGSAVAAAKDAEDVLVTARFKHVVTEGGHAVITGRDGDTIQRCEDEPIHIPGAIQWFGALVAFQEDADGRLVARVVSENSERVIGYTPRQLFALDSFTDILSEEQADNLLDHIDFVRDEGTDVEANGPEVFTISIRGSKRRSSKLWCAIHTSPAQPETIICEFELEDDLEYPLAPDHHATPELPEDTLGSEPTEREYRESTETQSRPLRVLRSARKRKGDAAAMEVFNIMSQVQEQLAQAPSLDSFLKVLVGVVKELTGFHRVMVYQFDNNFNGKVVTELVDPRATKDLYRGLHFPASDIPKQARDLYKVNKVRLLYDRDQETARLVCRTTEDLETPLDLTHSYLRAMSPIHIKYLANMAVRSSMSISINAFNELWGLISCHAYGANGTRVSFPIRKMCRLVGDSASRNIERLSYASRLQARKLINTTSTSKNPSGYIIASSEDLLGLFNADYGLLSVHDETKILGKLESTQEALALLEYLRIQRFSSVITSQDIRFDFQNLRYEPGFKTIAGLLLVPLSTGGQDFIVFFRKGQLKEVKWAGNPYEKFIKAGTEGYLEPRKSFKQWTETVVGKCKEWTEEEIETAGVLCLVYGKFIEVWRQKEAAMQNTQLTKLLLQNSAHEVRTPLNAIINYLEIALEGSLDSETREHIARSHSASKSLIYVINDLLDLTKTEASSQLLHAEAFDISLVFHEAVDVFTNDAKRKGLSFQVSKDSDLPAQVLGDPRRIRQAISNIVANAIEATSQGGITVDMGVAARYEGSIDIEIVIEDTGKGMSQQKLDELFAELEQAQTEFSANRLLDDSSSSDSKILQASSIHTDKNTLGLGLAVVARIVRNMEGQLRVKSEVDKGTRFAIVFPFGLPPSEVRPQLATTLSRNHSGPSGSITKETEVEGEVTLVAKASHPSVEKESTLQSGSSLTKRGSHGSLNSMNSRRSLNSMKSLDSGYSNTSQKSDVDRLIEAIQEPTGAMQRSSSSDSGQRLRRSRWSSSREVTPRPRSAEIIDNQPPHLRQQKKGDHGVVDIIDAGTPLRAIRVPDENMFSGGGEDALVTADQAEDENLTRGDGPSAPLTAEKLNVLIAEDDPINSKILQKRLQKSGHETFLSVNGEECASQYGERSGFYDIVLMDMQMPIVDGMTSAKMIRSFEKSHPTHMLSTRASLNQRVPIIAVSASLVEKQRQTYIDAGFDGWILKPVSFNRLNELLEGIVNAEVRERNLYQPGKWEQGGWFEKLQKDVFEADTKPDDSIPFSGPSEAAKDANENPNKPSEHMREEVELGMEPKENAPG